MSRLADALERAQQRRAGAPVSEAALATAPVAAIAAPSLALVTPLEPVRPSAAEPQARGSLLAIPTRSDEVISWRTNPETVGKLVGTEGFSGAAVEQYRKLAATLHHNQLEQGLKIVMTSSALPGEGKSLSACNLALTLSESYQKKVLLIDADLRRPSIQRVFGIPPISGLNEGLKAERDVPISVIQISQRLTVIPAGRPEQDPIGGLTSERMKRLLTQASAAYDWVIVDTPPVGLLPDASLITSLTGGVLLVVRCGKAPYSLIKRTVEALGHDRIIGVIMNAVDFAHDRNAGGYYEYYGYGYYGTAPGKKK
jgi:protein-tyrosine kinase